MEILDQRLSWRERKQPRSLLMSSTSSDPSLSEEREQGELIYTCSKEILFSSPLSFIRFSRMIDPSSLWINYGSLFSINGLEVRSGDGMRKRSIIKLYRNKLEKFLQYSSQEHNSQSVSQSVSQHPSHLLLLLFFVLIVLCCFCAPTSMNSEAHHLLGWTREGVS